jgi:hypothetical protein
VLCGSFQPAAVAAADETGFPPTKPNGAGAARSKGAAAKTHTHTHTPFPLRASSSLSPCLLLPPAVAADVTRCPRRPAAGGRQQCASGCAVLDDPCRLGSTDEHPSISIRPSGATSTAGAEVTTQQTRRRSLAVTAAVGPTIARLAAILFELNSLVCCVENECCTRIQSPKRGNEGAREGEGREGTSRAEPSKRRRSVGARIAPVTSGGLRQLHAVVLKRARH